MIVGFASFAAGFRRFPPHRFGRLVVWAACAACLAANAAKTHSATPAPAAPAGEFEIAVPLELMPYRVRVVVSFSAAAQFLPGQRGALLEELRANTVRCAGAMWQTEVAEDESPLPDAAAALRRLSVADAQARFSSDRFDKVFLLAIESQGAGYRLQGREFDTATSQWSLPQDRVVQERRDIPPGCMALMQELFRPTAGVEQTRAGAVVLHGRAAWLAPPDPDWAPLRAGRQLEPYYRHFDKAGAVERIQRVPWTWFVVDRPARAGAACTVVTGLRSPLWTRRRIETVALTVHPQSPQTRLVLRARPPSPKVLAGVEVDVAHDAREQPVRLISDRQGAVRIPVGEDRRLVWLSVRSGQVLLARLPLVPGVHSDESVELPDDALRLAVEGDISLLQADLVDTVARRAVISATIRARAKLGQWAEVDALFKQLADLPKSTAYASAVDAIRLPAVQAAKSAKDRAAEGRIQKLCDETTALIKQYLDADKLRQLKEEMDELRKIDADTRADAKALGDEATPPDQPAPPKPK